MSDWDDGPLMWFALGWLILLVVYPPLAMFILIAGATVSVFKGRKK